MLILITTLKYLGLVKHEGYVGSMVHCTYSLPFIQEQFVYFYEYHYCMLAVLAISSACFKKIKNIVN